MKEYKIKKYYIDTTVGGINDSLDSFENEINKYAKDGFKLFEIKGDKNYGILIFEKEIPN